MNDADVVAVARCPIQICNGIGNVHGPGSTDNYIFRRPALTNNRL
jgi:hypothetical protein